MPVICLFNNLPKDPDNLGSVLGWGVIQKSPWRFIGIYASEDAARAEATARGPRNIVEYGSHCIGTNEFVGGLTPPKSHDDSLFRNGLPQDQTQPQR